jgi:hypothetical protein
MTPENVAMIFLMLMIGGIFAILSATANDNGSDATFLWGALAVLFVAPPLVLIWIKGVFG